MKLRFLGALLCMLAVGNSLMADAACAYVQSNAEMITCSKEESINANKRMQATYQKLLNILDSQHEKSLLNAEAHWLQFRDSQCQLELEIAKAGAMSYVLENECMTQLTDERTKLLKKTIEQVQHYR